MSACALHTTGAPDMSTLDKIIFLADLIEPARDFPKVNKLRRDAKQDLDVALLRAADHTLKYLLKQQRLVDGRLLELHNQLIQHGVRYGNRAAKKIEASQ
jgi:HD superfamily phosphohydrolase YqeK